MSVTDGTSSRLLADPLVSVQRRFATSAFDRLKGLAATLLRAASVTVILDDGDDDAACDGVAAPAPSREIEAFARLVRKRGPTFVADASTQSWLTDALLLGGLGPVACAGVPLTLSDGTVAGCLCVVCAEAREWMRDEEDILRSIAGEIASRVELRRAQRIERARAAEAVGRVELLDTILANSADYLFVFDRNVRYTYASRAGALSIDQSPAGLIGRTLAEVGFAPEIAGPLEQQVRSVFLTGGSSTGEARVELPDGARNFEHVFSPVFGPTGRVDAVVATVRDITGRKAIEHDLKQAKTDAERAAMVKDQFLAALSHELRTPLTPVLATVSALSADDSLPPNVRSAVSMIRRNVELQTRLIDDLLDLTRVARGKIALKLDAIDLTVAVREAVEMSRSEADAKGVRVDIVGDAAPCYIRGDGARVRQVLWNLIKNAVKFTPRDGEVTVAILPANEGDDHVTLTVRDTGIGIPEHLIERIFQPFEQGDPQMAKRFGGLGLGLAISKALVELQGGELTARSPGIGCGATFTLTLPVSTLPPSPSAGPGTDASSAPAQFTASRRLRVLLVDDHEDTRYVLRRLLFEHDVRSAGCVSDALEEAALYDFDLLVSDIGLPDGSGLDLMRQLHARYGLKGIALSGYGMDDDVRRSLAAGFHAHLTKPVTAEALHAAIEAVASEIGEQPPDVE
jgi:PAS domain S-box-containing protein